MSNDPDVNQAAKETVFVFMKPPPPPSQPEEAPEASGDAPAEVGGGQADSPAAQAPRGPRPVMVEDPGGVSEVTSRKPRLFLMLVAGMLLMSAFVVVALVFAAIIAAGVLVY